MRTLLLLCAMLVSGISLGYAQDANSLQILDSEEKEGNLICVYKITELSDAMVKDLDQIKESRPMAFPPFDYQEFSINRDESTLTVSLSRDVMDEKTLTALYNSMLDHFQEERAPGKGQSDK